MTRALLVLCLTACGAGQKPAEQVRCPDIELAKLEAAYIAEATEACQAQSYDSCDALPALREKYREKRLAWQECQQ